MRDLMARERPAAGFWDLKLSSGGLVDAEFAAQTLSLVRPDLRDASPRVVLERAAAAILVSAKVVAAYDLQVAADQIIKLALRDGTTPDEAGRGLKARLTQACGCATWSALKPALTEARATIRAAYEAVMAAPPA